MAKKFYTDISMESVGRVSNALDPIADQDYVTKKYIEGSRKRVTSPQITTLSTYGNITGLVTDVLPVGNYSFRVLVRAQSSSGNNGYGFRIGVGSATLSNIFTDWKWPVSTDLSALFFSGYTQRSVTDNLVAASVGSANTDYMIVGNGFFTVTAQGTVAIQFRSENAGTAITVGIGSCIMIERLP